MEEKGRGSACVNDQAQPIGCPWQLLCYKTSTVECRMAVSQRLPDARCQMNCDMYTHLTALTTKMKELQEELHVATCAKRAAETS